jgi:hypothetical protein
LFFSKATKQKPTKTMGKLSCVLDLNEINNFIFKIGIHHQNQNEEEKKNKLKSSLASKIQIISKINKTK